jgi:hypothetical protein
MDVEAHRAGEHDNSPASSPGGRRGAKRAGLVSFTGATLLVLALVGCSPDDRVLGSADASASGRSSDDMENGDGMSDRETGAREIGFDELVDDPAALVGERVRVTGNVFFISECPPPGSGDAKCILLGYLADPERRTLIAADVTQAIALAEGGRRLSCVEGSQPTPTCGDWQREATYTIEGIVQRQVLGGREADLVQLDVSAKSQPQTW